MRHSTSILASIALAGLCAHPAASAAQTPARDNARPVVQAGTPISAPVGAADVTKGTTDVFGEVIAPVAVDDSESSEPTWDIDVRSYETQERVAHYVSLFSGRAKDHMLLSLERGSRYEGMIRSAMRAGGLPEDMYYLALVESGFDPHAYSRAAAVGMWQFMSSTGRDMGLRVDWWVDERRDPVKSTAAAVRFIKELRDQFGSLYLAAAAYNGGPGRVSRGLARYADDLENPQGDDAFFVLAEKDYLRNETREYVPQLIAAALIGKEPGRYGMALRSRTAFAYDSVRVAGATPLSAVAKAAGSSSAELLDLNPQFLRGMTPPHNITFVRVPVGSADGFESAMRELPKDALVATRSVETKKGDTMDGIADYNGVSSATLAAFNPGVRRSKKGKLVVGQLLTVPTAAVAALALRVPDPSIEKYPVSTPKLKLHVVKRGETLGGIARKYSLTKDRLMHLNGLRKPILLAGQSLVVSGPLKTDAEARSNAGSKGRARSRLATGKAASGKAASAKVATVRVASAKGATVKVASAKGATVKVASAQGSKTSKARSAVRGKTAGAGSKAGARKSITKAAGKSTSRHASPAKRPAKKGRKA